MPGIARLKRAIERAVEGRECRRASERKTRAARPGLGTWIILGVRRGLEVPMPVILIGVIGGMLADGLLGLFVGPVLLAVSYVLFMEWMRRQPAEGAPQVDGPAP